jgi:hypothetical protein
MIQQYHSWVIYPKECKTGYNKGTCTHMFIEALFIIAKSYKQSRCPSTDDWIKKNVIFIYNGVLFRIKFSHLQVNGWDCRTST